MRCFLISILPCHSSPAPAAERGPPVSTTAHEVGILPQRFVPGPGAARGKVPCYLRLSFQTQPSVAETHVSVRLLPGFKTCVHTVSGSMVPGPPFPRSDGSASHAERSGGAGPRILWLGRNGVLQIQRSTGDFLRIFLGSSHCWFCEHAGHQVQGLHSRLPAVVRRHCRAGRGAGALRGGGPLGAHFPPYSQGPSVALRYKAHWRRRLPGTQGAQGNLGELGCSGANHCSRDSGAGQPARPAGSGSSHTGPKCWSQMGALSSPGQGLCQKASVLSHSSRPTLPVLPTKQIQRFPNILFPCFSQNFCISEFRSILKYVQVSDPLSLYNLCSFSLLILEVTLLFTCFYMYTYNYANVIISSPFERKLQT